MMEKRTLIAMVLAMALLGLNIWVQERFFPSAPGPKTAPPTSETAAPPLPAAAPVAPQPPAAAAASFPLSRDLGRVHGVDARLGARKGEPGERVEPVVQALHASRHPAGFEDADFVVAVDLRRRHEAHRNTAFRAQAARLGEFVEPLERTSGAEPRAYGVENRMI